MYCVGNRSLSGQSKFKHTKWMGSRVFAGNPFRFWSRRKQAYYGRLRLLIELPWFVLQYNGDHLGVIRPSPFFSFGQVFQLPSELLFDLHFAVFTLLEQRMGASRARHLVLGFVVVEMRRPAYCFQ